MDLWLALAAGIALVVVLEIVAVRVYRRHRANRRDPLTRPGAEPVMTSLFAARDYLSGAAEVLGRGLQIARETHADEAQLLIEGMLEGVALQQGVIGKLCEGDGPAAQGRGPDWQRDRSEGRPRTEGLPEEPRDGDRSLAETMGLYASQAATWAFDVAPGAVELAKRRRCREAAKALRIAGEVESCHAEVAEALAGGDPDASHEISLCPTCGFIVFGRRPAFCVACGQPGFEMRALRKGLLD